VRLERRLEGADDVVAGVLAAEADVPAQHGAAPDVDDDEQPDALDLELLLEAKRVANDNLEPHVKAVAVELDDIQELRGRRRRGRLDRQALGVGGAGQAGAAREAAQALASQYRRERPDAPLLGVERIVAGGQALGKALAQEVQVQVLQAVDAHPQALVGANLPDRDALVAHALGDPGRERRVRLHQHGEGPGGPSPVAAGCDPGDAAVLGNTGIGHEGPPAEHASVLVRLEAMVKQAVEMAAIDAGDGLDLAQGRAARIELDRLPAGAKALAAAGKLAFDRRQRRGLVDAVEDGLGQGLGHERARRGDDGQHALPVGDPDAGGRQLGGRNDADVDTLDLGRPGLRCWLEQEHRLAAVAPEPEVDQAGVGLRTEARRAFAESEDSRISFETQPLPKAAVVEQPHAAAELRAEGFEQAAAARPGRVQRCGEILHGSAPYAVSAGAHPQSEGIASHKGEVSDSPARGAPVNQTPVARVSEGKGLGRAVSELPCSTTDGTDPCAPENRRVEFRGG
jgi:hypothetical protein